MSGRLGREKTGEGGEGEIFAVVGIIGGEEGRKGGRDGVAEVAGWLLVGRSVEVSWTGRGRAGTSLWSSMTNVLACS